MVRHRSLSRSNTACKVGTQGEQPKRNRMQKVLYFFCRNLQGRNSGSSSTISAYFLDADILHCSSDGTLLLFALVKPILHVISSAAELVRAKNRNLQSTVAGSQG
jgi:hypothetical protein